MAAATSLARRAIQVWINVRLLVTTGSPVFALMAKRDARKMVRPTIAAPGGRRTLGVGFMLAEFQRAEAGQREDQ